MSWRLPENLRIQGLGKYIRNDGTPRDRGIEITGEFFGVKNPPTTLDQATNDLRRIFREDNLAERRVMRKEVEIEAGGEAGTVSGLLQHDFMAMSAGTYYVNNDVCLGQSCQWKRIQVTDYAAINDNLLPKYVSVTYNGKTITFSNDSGGGSKTWSDKAGDDLLAKEIATVIQNYFGAESDEIIVAGEYDDYIFFRADVFTAVSLNYTTGFDPANTTLSTETAPCYVDSKLYGDCAYNTYAKSNIYFPSSSAELGGFPVIMSNCRACEVCIHACPALAIYNRLTKTAESLSSINPNLRDEWVKCAQAKMGDDL